MDPLKTLLQLQLASDASAVAHLVYVLSSLHSETFNPSSHLTKWTARLNSLIHSKDAGARWAGLCIAQKTAVCSRSLMLESAQSWVGAVLPLLSKNEPLPILKASIRLMRFIFTNALGVSEFQRQISTPNVPKFSLALVSLIEKQEDEELRILALETLSHLIPCYPTLHRALLPSLTSLSLRFLNGSTPSPTPTELLSAASRLFAVLHYTGGKVGAGNQWRKSFDETLAFAWGSFLSVRTTFPPSAFYRGNLPPRTGDDPIVIVPLNIDRLRAATYVLRDLMRTSNARPVVLHLGPVVRLGLALLSTTAEEQIEGHIDPVIRSLEVSVVANIREYGCNIITTLASCVHQNLQPHLSQLYFQITRQLEQQLPAHLRLIYLQTISALLSACPPLSDPLLPSRLARAILPFLTILVSHPIPTSKNVPGSNYQDTGKDQNGFGEKTRNGKGKKRARGYEGDEVFKITREVICPTKVHGEIVLAAIKVVTLLLRNSPVSPSIHSLSARVLLSIALFLPQLPSNLLSPDFSLHATVYTAVRKACTEFASGTTSMMSQSLGLIVGTSQHGESSQELVRELEILLHPRVPPLLRTLPHLESLALFRVEESKEESGARDAIGLAPMRDTQVQIPMTEVVQSQPTVQSVITMPTVMPPSSDKQVLALNSHQPVTSPALQGISVSIPTQIPRVEVGVLPAIETTSVAPTAKFTPLAAPVPSKPIVMPFTSTASSSEIQTSEAPITTSSSSSKTLPPASQVLASAMVGGEDEDENMPSINMDSDSDEE